MGSNELTKLAAAIERHTGADGVYNTAVPALSLSRFSTPTDLVALVYEPCVCVVVRGAKGVVLGEEVYRLDPAHSLLVSVDLPVEARVVEASPGRPYLAVRLSLDPAVVGELLADGTPMPGPPGRGIAVPPVGPPEMDAVGRLVALLDTPQDVAPLSPLVSARSPTGCSPGRRGGGCGRSPPPARRPTGSPARYGG